MKKTLSLLIAMVFVFSALAPCALADDAGKEAEAELPLCPLTVEEAYLEAAQPLTEDFYSRSYMQNDMLGSIFTFEGSVDSVRTVKVVTKSFDYAVVSTDMGPILLENIFLTFFDNRAKYFGAGDAAKYYGAAREDYDFPEVGEQARFVAIYRGYSLSDDMPYFTLGAGKAIYDMTMLVDPVAASGSEAQN